MFRDILEAVGRGIAAAARNPKWRVTSLERRAFFWRRESVRLSNLAVRAKSKRRKQNLYKRAAKASLRAVILDQRAQELAGRYGLSD